MLWVEIETAVWAGGVLLEPWVETGRMEGVAARENEGARAERLFLLLLGGTINSGRSSGGWRWHGRCSGTCGSLPIGGTVFAILQTLETDSTSAVALAAGLFYANMALDETDRDLFETLDETTGLAWIVLGPSIEHGKEVEWRWAVGIWLRLVLRLSRCCVTRCCIRSLLLLLLLPLWRRSGTTGHSWDAVGTNDKDCAAATTL